MEINAYVREINRTNREYQGESFVAVELVVEVYSPLSIEQVRVPREMADHVDQMKGKTLLLPVRPSVNKGYLNWYLNAIPTKDVEGKPLKAVASA